MDRRDFALTWREAVLLLVGGIALLVMAIDVCEPRAVTASAPLAPVSAPVSARTSGLQPVQVIAHFVDGTSEPMVIVQRPSSLVHDWRGTEARVFVTWSEMVEAFTRAGIPGPDRYDLATAWAECEAPYFDREAVGGRRVPPSIGIALYPESDGVHVGPGQFSRAVWGHLFDQYDPHTIDGAAALAREARAEAIRMGLPPLWPWTCAMKGQQ